MSTTVKTGWLNDKNGDKFAPKTLTSQVQTSGVVGLYETVNQNFYSSDTKVAFTGA